MSRKFASVLAATLMAGSFVAAVAGGNASAAPAANTNNVTICHRTHSVTNPYVKITVDQRSVGNANSKHGGGAHDYWATTVYASKPSPNVYNPAKTYPANDKKWGDIIAFLDVSGNALTGTAANVAGLNNTGIGASIFNGTGVYAGLCRTMNARDYYEVERSAGVPPEDILKDMDELDSPDLNTVLTACGGTFVGCDPTKLGTTSISIPTTTTIAAATATTVKGATVTTVKGATTTTVLSKATLAAGKGGLHVKIWVDLVRDKKKTDAEPNLGGITVTITGPGGVTHTLTTDSNGEVTFVDLDPGSWSVTSVLDVDGLETCYDKDGTVDWKGTDTVVAGEIAEDEFAACGSSALEVTDVKDKKVKVLWAGPDDKFGTDDDSSFVLAASDGRVTAQGLPRGKFKVLALSDGAVLAAATLDTDDDVTVAAVTLDQTGVSNAGLMAIIGLVMMAAGLALVGSRRRTATRI